MIQVIIMILMLVSNSILARQTCTIDPETKCCQVQFSGISGTAYRWEWVESDHDNLSVNLVSVSSDVSRLGAPNQSRFNVCMSKMPEEPMILTFQYKSQTEVAKQEEIEVICG